MADSSSPDAPQSEALSAKAEFNKLHTQRQASLERARECAELTIPSLLPPEGFNENSKLSVPNQSFGARAVNNLASKLLLTLLPPNAPFFKISVAEEVESEIKKNVPEKDYKAEMDYSLSQMERAIQSHIESEALRVAAFSALTLLVGVGNSLCYVPDEGGMKSYRPDQYVVKRDPMGNVLTIITVERIHPESIEDESVRNMALTSATGDGSAKIVELYTKVWLQDGEWNTFQEIGEQVVPGTEGTYPKDECPWFPIRWTSLEGEDYGRGPVEQYLGDFISLDGLSKAINDGAAAAAKLVFMVNPNGVTEMEDIIEAPNLGVVLGREDDVTTLQAEKYNDWEVVLKNIMRLEERLSQAFLLHSSVQRQAERVTAEEIRFMAAELEDALGGIYSILSQEFQRPLLKRLFKRLQRNGVLPQVKDKTFKMTITTGLEALGRGHDLSKLVQFSKAVIDVFGPEVASRHLDVPNFLTRLAASLGIETAGLVKPPEQLAQEQQQAMMGQMAGQVLPGAANEIVKGAVQGNLNEQQAALQAMNQPNKTNSGK